MEICLKVDGDISRNVQDWPVLISQVKLMSCKVEKIHTFMDYIKGGSVLIFLLAEYNDCSFIILF